MTAAPGTTPVPPLAEVTPGQAGPSRDDQSLRRHLGHCAMGLGWRKQGRTAAAQRSFERAIETDPGRPDAYLELAQLLADERRWDELVAFVRRSFAHQVELAELHKLHVTALEALGGIEDAFAAYGLVRADDRPLAVEPGEILACTTVRDERVRLPFFVDHHRRLGVDRFLFVDNGSTDGSREWLLDQPDVHVWTSELRFTLANFGSAWFELLLRRHGAGHWALTVDVDEFLVYEGSPERSLQQLCADLDRRGKRVATGVFLDLYGEGPVGANHYREGDDPVALCPYFDREWHTSRLEMAGQYANQTITFGGVRQRVFPTPRDYLLSKAPLVKYGHDTVLSPGQHLTNLPREVHAVDEVCLLHTKFLHTFVDYARREAARGVHAKGAEQYKAYERALDVEGDVVLYDPARSVRFEGTAQLRALGILQAEGAEARVAGTRVAGTRGA